MSKLAVMMHLSSMMTPPFCGQSSPRSSLSRFTIASSRDLIAIFVSLELISAPAFVLAGLRKGDVRSNEAALKFFLFSVLSSAVMLYGMSLVYGVTGGETNLAAINQALAGSADEPIVVPYTVFKAQVASGNVAEIYSQGANVEGRFVAAVTYPPEGAEPRADRGKPAEPRSSTSFTTTVPMSAALLRCAR